MTSETHREYSSVIAKLTCASVGRYGPRSVESLSDLKEFMYRIGLAMRQGMEPENVLRHGGIKTYWKRFTAAYRRERGEIPESHVTSVTRVCISCFR